MVKAITKHVDQLMATITLVCIITFIFSNFLGRFYALLFNKDTTHGIPICYTLKSCYFTTLNWGLKLGGGISEMMVVTDIESSTYNFYGKLMFDLSFFLLVNIISLNVIFGIIIDTFSELRTRHRERGKYLGYFRAQ